MEEEEQSSSKKLWIILGVILLLLLAFGAFLFFSRGAGGDGGIRSITSFFGNTGPDIPRTEPPKITAGEGDRSENPPGQGNTLEEPLFRHLANIPVSGGVAVVRDGKTFVRYVSREKGYIFEVDPETGQTTQLTNKVIPAIYEALWGNNGNTVVLRFLVSDPRTQKDVIKTYLADLALPLSSDASSTTFGDLLGDFLPDNISEVSISPDGTRLLYLLPIPEGISGTMVMLSNKAPKEILRNAFTEWLPQMLNNGKVILSTKPSSGVEGYAYLYNPADKTLSRILREKKALTTLATPNGDRILYSENTNGNTLLGLYDAKGFVSDSEESSLLFTAPIQLSTLPEKCVWTIDRSRMFCGAFTSTPKVEIPDAWYQGMLSFHDTFWTINANTTEISFLADPQREGDTNASVDVYRPFMGGDEKHFFFIDKNDSTLWSMRIQKEKYVTEIDGNAKDTPVELTPEEQKDAAGSTR